MPKRKEWDLSNIKTLCKALGQPQKSFESIHIVGTNGKGSTSFYLANILQAHGVCTGLFTSPHLVDVRERFWLNGKLISQHDFDSILHRVEKAAEAAKIEPSFFEVLTAVAFVWFKEKKVQVAVLEAGLGGRLDSTKVAEGRIAAITGIGLDHTDMLGSTHEQILKEKLGILKKGATLLLGNLPRNLISKCPKHIKAKKITPALQTGNFGKIYAKNAELACAIAKEFLFSILHYKFSITAARTALKASSWPGRMQIMNNLILDGAHNPQAAKILVKCLKEKRIPPLPCVFASLSDKDTQGVLKALKPHITVCYPMPLETPRARSVNEISEICKTLGIKTKPFSKSVIKKSKTRILATGSLYLVGELLKSEWLFSHYPFTTSH